MDVDEGEVDGNNFDGYSTPEINSVEVIDNPSNTESVSDALTVILADLSVDEEVMEDEEVIEDEEVVEDEEDVEEIAARRNLLNEYVSSSSDSGFDTPLYDLIRTGFHN